METWRDEGFPDKPRPQPERGSVMRWEIWEGEAEVVTSMRETLWKLARCAQTREISIATRGAQEAYYSLSGGFQWGCPLTTGTAFGRS